jgi:hypothetical protein
VAYKKGETYQHRVKEERNILYTVKRRKANWIGYVWRTNCLLKQVTEENIGDEMTRKT